MSFRKIKYAAAGVAVAAVVGVTAALSGCTIETGRPRARITVEFNGTEYVIDFELYRDMYPQTVRHFIELADEGFYDDTVIHDYTSNDIYGGGYKYDQEKYEESIGGGSPEDYLDDSEIYLEDDYYALATREDSPITPSVFDDAGYTYDDEGEDAVLVPKEGEALPTLYG